ncbi:uncharacterized protein LOC117116654 [Anneissia japonica]|uniref:uncharacterized protein LOC117116654 n=1 Tax=Anneissia japonica TaxID=1529436 RepID=UPI0014255DF6|nr:uncharacterized protein LOC117116654 [Anneissia japonica]
MASLEALQNQLRKFPSHFVWNLEDKSMIHFQTLFSLITRNIAESPAMIIEGLLFKSYLYFSDFRGNVEKKKPEAIDCLNEVRRFLTDDQRETSFKDGYLLIALALEAWLDRDKTKLEAKISTLRTLESKYEAGSRDRDMFLGSIYATKGFAFSRLGMIRYSESIEEFQKAVNLCPNEIDWLFALGLVIWRKGIPTVKINDFCDEMQKAVSIFYDVLNLDHNHSYAMTLIAELKRRRKRYLDAERFLERALASNPSNEKTISEVAKVYRRMKKYDVALNILIATPETERSSFTNHQIYLVYRDTNTLPPVNYLQKAIDVNPCNLAARFDQVKEYITKRMYNEARECLDHILDNYGNDPEAVIRTNYNFAKLFEQMSKDDAATDSYQALVDKALKECKLNNDPPFIFFPEVDWMVRQSIKQLREYFKGQLKAHRNVKESLLKLAELEKTLGNHGNACRYYEQIITIQPPIDTELKWTILEYLGKIKTRKSLLTDVNFIIQDMEDISLENPKPDILHKCKANVAVEKGKIALRNGKENDAINLFIEAVKFGSLAGASLLLDEVKKINRGNRDFYTSCAQIIVFIEQSDNNETVQLKRDLDTLLSADTSEIGIVLCDLRKTQVNLEKFCILQDETQIAVFRVDIIHKCRTILNQTMAKFKDRHYAHVKVSCDFFSIPKCSSAKVTQQVRNKLQKKYEWSQFEHQFPDLFHFLVSIQPASNPHDNNWMFALLRMDNANKHESPLGEKLKVEVYSDNAGNMAEQEFTTIEVAREACDNIGKILNEFYKYL